MKNFKWSVVSFDDRPIYVVLFVSRKKDNKDVEGFVERRESFITHHEWNDEVLTVKFEEFTNRGVACELSRMYFSINHRDGKKIYKELLHFLLDNPEFNLCSLSPKLAGIAAKKECALSKRWMFDFDCDDEKAVNAFIADIHSYAGPIEIELHKTPHGYAVITEHGFDTRKLLEDWPEVGLKRDDLLCVKWKEK
jgi:hypothetical protein